MPAPREGRRVTRRDARTRTREALAGRRWLLALLSAPPRACVPPPPAIGPASWRLLFAVEGVGLPVSRVLREHGRVAVPEALRSAADAAAVGELQRVMMARAQLREIDALAVQMGVTPLVIKGGAVVHTDAPLDLGDIDIVLPTHAEARRFAAALDAYGYAPQVDDDALVNARHLPARYRAGALPVEVHVNADYTADAAQRADAEPVAGCGALHRSAGVDEAIRVMGHTVVHHYFRRGHLRDVVLLSDALRRCGAAGADEVRAAISSTGRAVEAQNALLALAEAVWLGSATSFETPDAFAAVAAMRYESWQRRPLLSRLFTTYGSAAGRSLGDATGWWHWFRSRAFAPIPPVSFWYLPRVRRHSERLAWALGHVARVPHRLALVACVAITSRAAHRRALRDVIASTRSR